MATIAMGPRFIERKELLSPYMERDLCLGNEQVKQEQRDRVLDHTKKYHQDDQRMRFFTLPGAWWTFEQQVCDCGQWERPEFVAAERNYEVMRHGATFMPGRGVHRIIEPLKSHTVHGLQTDQAKILWMSGSLLADIDPSDYQNKRAKWEWSKRYKRWTAAWWDFMAPLNNEVLQCLAKTDTCLSHDIDIAPVSITLIGAREEPAISKSIRALVPESVPDRRVVFLERWYNLGSQSRFIFSVTEHFAYTSEGGTPMLLINALLTRRGE